MKDNDLAGKVPINRLLKMAVLAGVEAAVRIHIRRGDDLNARDAQGMTALMLAASKNRVNICELLLSAGADPTLRELSGRDALAVARQVGALNAISLLESVNFEIEVSPLTIVEPDMHLPVTQGGADAYDKAPVPVPPSDPVANNPVGGAHDLSGCEPPIAQVNEEPTEPEKSPDIDSLGWEPEENNPPPETDISVARAASAIQAAISVYKPIDSSVAWEDIDAYLPERSLPLARAGDTEARERLRRLLLRAVREGSVPSMDVKELSFNHDRSANPEAEALLSMVLNDLGAEVDERFEYANADENFEVFVRPEETPDEEEIIAGALAFVDNLASHHSEPLRIYQQELQRERLISAEEEVSLAQAMEIALERALDALAAWPGGIGVTLSAGHLIKARQRPLSWLSLGPIEALPDLESALTDESDVDVAIPDQTDEEVEPDDDQQYGADQCNGNHAAIILDALDRLALLPVVSIQHGAEWLAVREALSSLRLNRRFLLELTDVEHDGDSDSATQYTAAMKAYCRARERMVSANLKLAFHLAKKFLYSGEPLDDLAQEGNIGLLKAIERFDWRRGFKFSTYATWWIRQQVGRYVADKCRTIRIPVHMYEKAIRLSRETRAFKSETGREPQRDEIASRLGLSPGNVTAIQNIVPEPSSMHDIPIDELIAIDARPDYVSPDPFDVVSGFELCEMINLVLSTLKPKEEEILRLRFGIGFDDSLTLEEVGRRYEVTRERIRQIEAKALRKMQVPSKMDALSFAYFGCPFPQKASHQDGKAEEDVAWCEDAERVSDPDLK